MQIREQFQKIFSISRTELLEKGRVANTPYSKGVLVMFNIINALQGSEKKKDVISDIMFTSAPFIDESCNRLFDWRLPK